MNDLAMDHGGAGRGIQVAVEHLSLWKDNQHKELQKELAREDRQGKPEPFSFAAFPRTRSLVNTLSVRYYGSKTEVVRACIAVLSNIKALDLLTDEPGEAS